MSTTTRCDQCGFNIHGQDCIQECVSGRGLTFHEACFSAWWKENRERFGVPSGPPAASPTGTSEQSSTDREVEKP